MRWYSKRVQINLHLFNFISVPGEPSEMYCLAARELTAACMAQTLCENKVFEVARYCPETGNPNKVRIPILFFFRSLAGDNWLTDLCVNREAKTAGWRSGKPKLVSNILNFSCPSNFGLHILICCRLLIDICSYLDLLTFLGSHRLDQTTFSEEWIF